MTSKMDKKTALGLLHEPKTKYEEIILCIESTNDIVSEIAQFLKFMFPKKYEDYRSGSKR